MNGNFLYQKNKVVTLTTMKVWL